tara:strand:+ start:636 stop:908 length:273 start_codon:yes stop_codon:yes gene_type:complete
MRPEHIESVLVSLHGGQWFGWQNGNKVYADLIIHSEDEKPTQAWLETELSDRQAAWDAAVSDEATNKASAKSKLAELGLSENEISAAFGI